MSELVNFVFSRLAAEYGSAWDRSLGNAPLSDVKTVWGEKLDGFTETPELKKCIMWALANLPDRCPNSIEFRNLCRQAPSEQPIALPLPKPNPEMAKLVMEKLAKAPSAPIDNRAWAKAILRDVENGVRRTPTVIQMAKNALEVA